jgi:outer membrane protein assembly complex protein YaeT
MDRWKPLLRHTAAALVGLLVCGSLVSMAQTPSGKIIVEDVIPEGNGTVPKQKIISLIKTRPGTEFNQETINEDVRRLYETKLFANIRVHTQQVSDTKIRVYILVAEYPSTVQEVVYQGNHHLKPDELEVITGIRKGSPLNPIANQMACQAILRRYQDMGRMLAGVELKEGGKPGDTRVVFSITEGPVIRVSHIDIVGGSFVSEARLRTQIRSSISILGLGGSYDPEEADRDVGRLEEYFRNNGYQNVHVSKEVQWEPDYRHVHLIFHVNQGQRYRIATLQVDGNKLFTQEQLLARSKLHAGDYYNKGQVENDVQIIQAVYGYGGHAVAVREQDVETAPGEVAVHYEVQERPAARVGQIFLVGNDVTKQNVIIRQVELYPGQPLTYPDLKQSEKNLARLNIFESNPANGVRPTVSVINPDDDNEFKDILVEVKEEPTGSLMFGVGVNSDAGLIGSIVLNERNFDITNWPTSFDDLLSGHAFRGAGQEFRAEAVPGTQLQRYTISFREPYLFDSKFGFNASVYYWDRIYNEYTESRLGTRLGLSRRLNPYWSVSATLRLEDVGIHNVSIFEPEEIQVDEGQHFLAGIRPAITRDTRDSYLRPTEGSKVELSFEQFFGDYTFPQVNLEASKYFTVYQRADGSGRHVLALRSELGYTGPQTPVFERFYAGGFASMRGFEFRGVGPAVDGFEVGGDFLFLDSIEYQIPILANDQLYAVAFVDSGTVERTVEIRDYRVSAGFGLRVTVPMLGPVPIALDFGFPIVKGPQDHEQVFSFWVGFFH